MKFVIFSQFQETQVTLNALQDEFHKKDEMIAALQNNSKENCSVNEEVSEVSIFDSIFHIHRNTCILTYIMKFLYIHYCL